MFIVTECITVKTICALKKTSMFAVFGGPPTHTATPKEPHPISTTLRSVQPSVLLTDIHETCREEAVPPIRRRDYGIHAVIGPIIEHTTFNNHLVLKWTRLLPNLLRTVS